MVRLPLLSPCNGVVVHTEVKYPAPGLHVVFAKEEQKAQLSTLIVEDGLQEMMEGKNYRIADAVFLFVERLISSNLDVVESCNLARMSVL